MYDIIIIGKSFIGSLMALTLKHDLPNLKIGFIHRGETLIDQRATALSESSVNLLKKLEIWEYLKPVASPIHEILIGMNPKNPPLLTFKEKHEPLGYNLPNNEFYKVLKDVLSLYCFDEYQEAKIQSVSILTSFAKITLDNHQEIKTRLIIGADGKASVIRSLLGASSTIDYHQTAFTGRVQHDLPHNGRAFEFFIPQGALAFIPLKDKHQSTVVWSLKNHLVSDQLDIQPILSGLMGSYLGKIYPLDSFESYPLYSIMASKRYGHRWVLIGDAANTLHPVAGQGMNLAIRDVLSLSTHLLDHVNLGLDIGSISHLSTFNRLRQLDRYALLGVTHASGKWITTSSKSFIKIIEKAMSYFDKYSILREFFSEKAAVGTAAYPHKMLNKP